MIYLWSAESNRFERAVERGFSEAQLEEIERRRRSPGGDLTDDIAREAESFFVPDMSSDWHFGGLWQDLRGRSYVNVPLKSKGNVTGTMELIGPAGRPLTEREVELLKAAGHQIGIAIENASLVDEIRRNAQQTLALYRLGAQVSASLELRDVMQAIAGGAREMLDAECGFVGLLGERRQEIVIKAVSHLKGRDEADCQGLALPLADPAVAGTLAQNEPLWVATDRATPALARLIQRGSSGAAGPATLLAVPLWRSGALQGLVGGLSQPHRTFSDEEELLLTRLSQQVVIALENARLYQQVRLLAALQERDRLAREVHDNLAQAVGYLNLRAALASDLLARGTVSEAQKSLAELRQVSQQVYTDTREAIFNLRTTTPAERPLLPLLQEYLREYQLHYGVEAQLEAQEEAAAALTPEASMQIVRIVQEALANVRRHASANRAWVRLEAQAGEVHVTIQDDGCGFDPEKVVPRTGHYGLQMMRERAEEVGGKLQVDSAPGRGTRIMVRVQAAGNWASRLPHNPTDTGLAGDSNPRGQGEKVNG